MTYKFLGFFGLLFCINLFSPSNIQAKEYTIPELRIEVQINADGTLRIIEHRTYQFDGAYSWANYKLPKTGFSNIKDIRISEGDISYTNQNNERNGSFLVEESDDAFNIKWFYEAEDEERIFTVSYTLENAVTVGPEWSEFFWNYASSGREKSTNTIVVSISLPKNVPSPDLHAWIREPLSKIENRSVSGGYEFTGSDINRHEDVLIRTVFPTSVFEQKSITVTDSDFSLKWAEDDEAAYWQALQQNKEWRTYLFHIGIQLTLVLIAISIAVFLFLYRRYSVRHKVRSLSRESLLIPGKLEPAAAGWLLSGRNSTGGHALATLLDLARKGYFKLEETEPGEKKFWGPEPKPSFKILSTDKEYETELTHWEKSMLGFVKKRLDKNHEKIEEVFEFNKSEVYKWFSSWKKEVKEYCQTKNWIDQKSYKGVYWNLGIQFVLTSLAVTALIFTHAILLVAIFFCLLAFVFSFAMIRRTPKGEETFHKWKDYKNALLSAKDYSIPNDHLGKHFIYGVAFGMNKQHIEDLFIANSQAIPLIYWLVIMPNSRHTPAEMASAFSTLSATGSASFGGSGAGAGASAGAAGGGASGGAG